jgi:hypothetical protein
MNVKKKAVALGHGPFFGVPPAAALRSLSSVALSSEQATATLSRKCLPSEIALEEFNTPPPGLQSTRRVLSTTDRSDSPHSGDVQLPCPILSVAHLLSD